jgi:hypothetical protein
MHAYCGERPWRIAINVINPALLVSRDRHRLSANRGSKGILLIRTGSGLKVIVQTTKDDRNDDQSSERKDGNYVYKRILMGRTRFLLDLCGGGNTKGRS